MKDDFVEERRMSHSKSINNKKTDNLIDKEQVRKVKEAFQKTTRRVSVLK